MTEPFHVQLTVDENLSFFTAGTARILDRAIKERTSIKDVIESCGIPHTEVDLIIVNGRSVGFGEVLHDSSDVRLRGVGVGSPQAGLQTRHHTRFVADGHLGKLTRRLRLLGLDVVYDSSAADSQLVNTAVADDRALLTRDRRLLMHRSIRHGYYLRSQHSDEQLAEVIRRFQLGSVFAPFTRCLRCNAELKDVSKAEVLARLEPLTKQYYQQFRRCAGCGQVYWPGSHYGKLAAYVERVCGQACCLPQATQLATSEE